MLTISGRFYRIHRLALMMWGLAGIMGFTREVSSIGTRVLLPDGREFVSWEKPLQFTKTYYVDNQNPKASDSNPGTEEMPFLTINKAAQILEPGERVVIMSGIYRERVAPARGGTGPEKMISYETAPGAKVLVKGSRLIKKGWQPSSGFSPGWGIRSHPPQLKIYQIDLEPMQLGSYNAFGLVNVLDDRTARTGPLPQSLVKPYLRRRGLVFVDGQRLEQVELYHQLVEKEGTYWSEHNGMCLHVRLPRDADPADHEVELVVQEQVFSPYQRYLGYIRVKGITFEQAANGFPVPQRGLVSANRGHHWIIEDCVIRQANSVGLDIGNETWNADRPALIGYSIVRRNLISDAGVCGLAGMWVMETLVEYNTIEHVGWQNVEGMHESGGIKLHIANSCLLRNNVIRHMHRAPGIWLDYANVNTRVTDNVIGDVETYRGGIFLEASHERNMLDHNLIWQTTMVDMTSADGSTDRVGGNGIIMDGSDETIVAHNLLGSCEYAGVRTRTIEERVVEGRGGTARWNQLLNNIFYKCSKSIEFSNPSNKADGNLYAKRETIDQGHGLNWISTPEVLRLDLPAWQKYFGFDTKGAYGDLKINVDIDSLTMTWSLSGEVSDVETGDHFYHDFHGKAVSKLRKPGPFAQIPGTQEAISIDPRAGH